MTTDAGGAPASLTKFWRMEDANIDATHGYIAGSGDTSGAASGDAVFNTAANKAGTNGLDLPNDYDYVLFDSNVTDYIAEEQGTVAFWFRVTTWADGANLWYAYDDGSNLIRIRLNGTDEIQAGINHTSGNSSITTSEDLSTATWYWVEYTWDTSANTHSLKVWDTTDIKENPTVDTTENETLYAITVVSEYYGTSGAPNADVHMDLCLIFNAYGVETYDYRDYTSYTDF
jgi:hypothetical protein